MITRDLLLALLSLDSYNRGYDRNVNTPGTKLGDISLGRDSSILLDDANERRDTPAGFYAIVYNTSGLGIDGLDDTVISYRGTNFNPSASVSEFTRSPLIADALDGWLVGGGFVDVLGVGNQAGLAIDFYNAVLDEGVSPFEGGITLTGHSLGAGLAGLVGSIYGQSGTLYDNMTFTLAADNVYLDSLFGLRPELRQRVYGDSEIFAPDSDNLNAFATTGEILQLVLPARLSQDPSVMSVDSNGGVRDPIALHSQALLVSLIWARDNASEIGIEWQEIGSLLWDAYFEEEIAESIAGTEEFRGPLGARLGVFNSAIAYSAIEGGNNQDRPFGDVAIRSMFDDADDLGKSVDDTSTIKRSSRYLAEMFVQYAGKLALGDVERENDPDAVSGILALTADTLTVDLSNATWAKGSDHTKIVGRKELVSIALSDIDVDVQPPVNPNDPSSAPEPKLRSDLLAGLRWLFSSPSDPLELIERIVFRRNDGSFVGSVPPAIPGSGGNSRSSGNGADPEGLTLFVSGGGNDQILGLTADDFIVGGDGSDFIRGGEGDDLIAGGDGDDVLSGGAGRNFISGGDGHDILDMRFDNAVGGLQVSISKFDAASDEEREGLELTFTDITTGEQSVTGLVRARVLGRS